MTNVLRQFRQFYYMELASTGEPPAGPIDLGPETWVTLIDETFPDLDPERRLRLKLSKTGQIHGVWVHKNENADENVFNPCTCTEPA